MSNDIKKVDINENTVILSVLLNPTDNNSNYRQNIHDYIRDHSGWYWN